MDRQAMIDELVEHELEVNFSDMSFVREVIRTGYMGYDNLTDDELKSEYDYMKSTYECDCEDGCDECEGIHDDCK